MNTRELRGEPLSALEHRAEFARRHIGADAVEQAGMLHELGFASRQALIDAVVPDEIRLHGEMPLAQPLSEAEALARLHAIASRNRVLKSMIGQGYYATHTPAVILRNVLENPAWYTAYTPYQPEISQGRLETLLAFQTMVCDLTGMEIANASMLDEATAAAEAMTLLRRVSSAVSGSFFVADDVFTQTLAVVRTRAAPL
ncbi:MAG: glycine dehydrogenase (aminomethyl-transferring), partial [Casimicrobiaceae bacterium]